MNHEFRRWGDIPLAAPGRSAEEPRLGGMGLGEVGLPFVLAAEPVGCSIVGVEAGSVAGVV